MVNDLNSVWLSPAVPILNATTKADVPNHPDWLLEGTPIRRNPDRKSAVEVQAPVQPFDAVVWVDVLASFAQPVTRL